jgi:hypothetical protein
MNSEGQSHADDPDEILAEVIGRLIDMHNRLGHELIAVQSVCAYLVAKQCVEAPDPLAAVHEAAALFSGTGVALADLSRNDSRYQHYDTRGATDAFERIGAMAEENIFSLFREGTRRRDCA